MSSEVKVVEVLSDELDALRNDSLLLELLKEQGVEDWEGYDEALEDLELGQHGTDDGGDS